MIEIEWGTLRRARIWWDELPPATFTPVRVLERTVGVSTSGALAARSAALEVLIPLGGRIAYGLLGLEVSFAESASATIQVGISAKSGGAFPHSLAGGLDEVRVGLPDELAACVAGGVMEAIAAGVPARGAVWLRCSAYGQVGSSQHTFSALARAVPQLLTVAHGQRTAAALAEILDSTFAIK